MRIADAFSVVKNWKRKIINSGTRWYTQQLVAKALKDSYFSLIIDISFAFIKLITKFHCCNNLKLSESIYHETVWFWNVKWALSSSNAVKIPQIDEVGLVNNRPCRKIFFSVWEISNDRVLRNKLLNRWDYKLSKFCSG